MSPTPMTVSVVVVSYNVRNLLAACLESLRDACRRGEADQVIVVDSASSDGSPEMVRLRFPEFELLEVPNRGYGAGANAGIARARGEAILILNSDTVVQPGAIQALAEELAADPRTAIVGPRLVYPDGSPQPTRRRFPRRWTPVFESTILEEWFPGNRWVRHYRMTGEPLVDSQEVDWLVGAALMVRRAAIEQAGGFDEGFWLYGEELEWCYRLRRHGWRVRYVDRATIVHHEGASAGQDQLHSRLAFDRGRLRAHQAIHGARAARAAARLITLHYAVQLAHEALKWALGHRRELRAERVARYWTLLRSDLDVDG